MIIRHATVSAICQIRLGIYIAAQHLPFVCFLLLDYIFKKDGVKWSRFLLHALGIDSSDVGCRGSSHEPRSLPPYFPHYSLLLIVHNYTASVPVFAHMAYERVEPLVLIVHKLQVREEERP